MSTTIGPRGASINLGARGAYLNLGLPGTGLSYRTALNPSPAPSSPVGLPEPRDLYPSLRGSARRQRQEARDAERREAEALQDEREERLEALVNILGTRERENIDWQEEYASQGPYLAAPFLPAMGTVSEGVISEEVRTANPLKPWLIFAASSVASAGIGPQFWIRGPALLLAAYSVGQVLWLVRARRRETTRVLELRKSEHESRVAAQRAAHEAEQAQRAEQHSQEEALRARLRSAIENSDVEAAALVLEVELSNEDLPIALTFEAEFNGLSHLSIQVELPELEEIPSTRSRVTKTGKFSERSMAVRDRVALYQDVCAALVLRLIHEVYRVLPFTEAVDLDGIAKRISPTTGHAESYSGLRVSTTRQRFLAINLDAVDPSEALLGLGAQFATTREGVFKPLGASGD